jgi:hypothetical protein
MKKLAVPVLLSLGVFMLVGAVMSRAYVYPRLAVVPGNLEARVVAQSPDREPAVYFSVAQLREQTAPLKSITAATVDAAATQRARKELGRDVLVLRSYTCTDAAPADCTTNRYPLAGALSTVAVDRRTGAAVDWSGNTLRTEGRVRNDVAYDGYLLKLPFNTRQTDYPFWNQSLEQAPPMRYVDETTLQGLRVYRFRQVVPPTVISDLDLPGTLAGGSSATVRADLVFGATTEAWVEPETGVVISARSVQDSYAAVGGRRVLTITQGTLETPGTDVAAAIDDYTDLSRSLHAVRVVLPLAGTTLGLLCLAGVLLLVIRGRRRERAQAAEDVTLQEQPIHA